MPERILRRVVHIDGNCKPTDLPSGDRRGHGKRRVMIVIDEALSWFGIADDPKRDPRKAVWADWLRHSDKVGQDIFLSRRIGRRLLNGLEYFPSEFIFVIIPKTNDSCGFFLLHFFMLLRKTQLTLKTRSQACQLVLFVCVFISCHGRFINVMIPQKHLRVKSLFQKIYMKGMLYGQNQKISS